jgi:hypothetical protein
MRTLASVLLAGCLGLGLLGPAAVGAEERRHGARRIAYAGDCIDTPGHMAVRQVRRGDRLVQRMRVRGMQHRRWRGQASVLYGGMQSSGGQAAPFKVRTPHGRARHAAVLDVPDGFSTAGVTLWGLGTEDQPMCDLSISRTKTLASVGMYSAYLTTSMWHGSLHVEYTNYVCDEGATWRGRVVATWPDGTVREADWTDECFYGSVNTLFTLPGERLPRAVSFEAHDDAGHVWRMSYAVGR